MCFIYFDQHGWLLGGYCQEGYYLRLYKKRNKSATLRLLDVLATQHAKWTARRIRRALFGQSLVDFSGSSWSCIKIRGPEPDVQIENRRKKKVSRMMQEFSQTATEKSSSCTYEKDSLIPGMALYTSQTVDVDFSVAGTATSGISLSTSAVHHAEISQSLDRAQGSSIINRDFSLYC